MKSAEHKGISDYKHTHLELQNMINRLEVCNRCVGLVSLVIFVVSRMELSHIDPMITLIQCTLMFLCVYKICS